MHGKWTKENFDKHHRDNPRIYELFERYALKAAAARPYYSAKAIFHRVRWYSQIEEKNSDFKMDDGWISHYARLFMEKHPEHDGFFQIRTRRNSYHNEATE